MASTAPKRLSRKVSRVASNASDDSECWGDWTRHGLKPQPAPIKLEQAGDTGSDSWHAWWPQDWTAKDDWRCGELMVRIVLRRGGLRGSFTSPRACPLDAKLDLGWRDKLRERRPSVAMPTPTGGGTLSPLRGRVGLVLGYPELCAAAAAVSSRGPGLVLSPSSSAGRPAPFHGSPWMLKASGLLRSWPTRG